MTPPIPMPEGEPPNRDVQTDEDADDTLYDTPNPGLPESSTR